MDTDLALQWVEENQGMVRKDLLTLDPFTETTGRGIKAVQDIPLNTLMMEVPKSCLICKDNVGLHGTMEFKTVMEGLKERARESDVIAIWLMWAMEPENQRHIPQSLANYLNMLPEVENGVSALNQFMFWTEDELEWLQGTDAGQLAVILKQQIRQDFGKVVADIFMGHQDIFPVAKFTYEKYKRALGIIYSRGMDFHIGQNSVSFRAIVPFCDMINTDFKGPVSHSFVISRNVVQVHAKQNFKADEQVFINYSPTSNTRLLQLYGMAIPPPKNLAYDVIELWCPMNPSHDQFEAISQKIKEKIGFTPNDAPFLLSCNNPVPEQLIQALHMQRGIEEIPSKAVLLELLNAMKARQSSYFNKGDRMADLKLAMRKSELPVREQLALFVRMSEGTILEKVISHLEKQIEAITDTKSSSGVEAPENEIAEFDEMD